MSILIAILIFLVALAALLKGADFLIDGASNIAGSLKVPPILIGLSIVAFGTSLPEFIVSLVAAINGSAGFSFANIVGSNLANIGIGIGVSALLVPLTVTLRTLSYELPILSTSVVLLLFLTLDKFLLQKDTLSLGRIDGLILLVLFFIFCTYLYKTAKEEPTKAHVDFKEYQDKKFQNKDIGIVIGGIVLLAVGGHFLVQSASSLALAIGLSEVFVAVTMVALGTSLPELATTIMAVKKGHSQMAIGNIVGTNIFNILFVLGTVSVISPMTITPEFFFVDTALLLVFTLVFLGFVSTQKKVTRMEGAILLLGYLGYVAYLFASIL